MKSGIITTTTITEKFNDEGNLIERTTITEERRCEDCMERLTKPTDPNPLRPYIYPHEYNEGPYCGYIYTTNATKEEDD